MTAAIAVAEDARPVDRLADTIAGVSMAGLLLPEAVAYSGIAGMPPQAGVFALFAGLVVGATTDCDPGARSVEARTLLPSSERRMVL